MKTLMICFSQTGNTRAVAEQIADGIREKGNSCEFVNLADVETDALGDYDLVGLGCPVFYFKEPFNVRAFISDLPELKGKHWFVFCTHGSAMGTTLVSMNEGLKEKGIILAGGHHTYADATVPFYPYPTFTTGHPDEEDFEKAREFGGEVVERSRQISKGDKSLVFEPEPVTEAWARKEADLLSLAFMNKYMPRLCINEEKCIQCGECEENCPVEGIKVDADPPVIQNPCIYCWHCVKLCPTAAIEADWDRLVSMAPDNYARYREALNEAEHRGEFRWLVDPDSIDCNDPLYKQRERDISSKTEPQEGRTG